MTDQGHVVTDQASLFALDDRRAWQRRSLPDPSTNLTGAAHELAGDTEHKAAALVAPKTGTLRARILEKLEIAGHDGRTGYELQSELGDLHYSIPPRLTELRGAGWIVDSQRRRATPSGAEPIVWVLSERAQAEPGGSA
ncbi:MAG: hypothetical protein M3P18_06980 [Actinomycetota bacterium]|nr:hypothetical protein [Actinomycetota bacterium]